MFGNNCIIVQDTPQTKSLPITRRMRHVNATIVLSIIGFIGLLMIEASRREKILKEGYTFLH